MKQIIYSNPSKQEEVDKKLDEIRNDEKLWNIRKHELIEEYLIEILTANKNDLHED